jgi:hypothetical protein
MRQTFSRIPRGTPSPMRQSNSACARETSAPRVVFASRQSDGREIQNDPYGRSYILTSVACSQLADEWATKIAKSKHKELTADSRSFDVRKGGPPTDKESLLPALSSNGRGKATCEYCSIAAGEWAAWSRTKTTAACGDQSKSTASKQHCQLSSAPATGLRRQSSDSC